MTQRHSSYPTVLRTIRATLVCSSLALALHSGTAFGASAPADRSWGRAGSAHVTYGNIGGSASELSLDPNGRLYAFQQGSVQHAFVRLTARGQVDTTWGRSGVVLMPGGAAPAVIGSRAFLYSPNATHGMSLKRLTDRGAVDSSFGSSGTVTIPLPALEQPWRTMPVWDSGLEISASGIVRISRGSVWRASQDGFVQMRNRIAIASAPVRAFSATHPRFSYSVTEGGYVHSALDAWGRPWFSDPNGIFRYGASGPDPIGVGGSGVDQPFDAFNFETLVRAHGNGVLVFGRYADRGASDRWALLRLDEHGIPDPNFGQDGVVTLPSALSEDAYQVGLRVTRNGSIDAALSEPGGSVVELHRISVTGTPVAGFGRSGRITLRSTAPADAAGRNRVVFDRQDRAYVAIPIDGRQTEALIRRFATDSTDLGVGVTTRRLAAGTKRLTITVANRGPRATSRVVIRATFPRMVRIRHANAPGAACRIATTRTSRIITCARATLPVGATTTGTIVVRAAGRATATIRATSRRRDVRPASNTRSVRL